MTSRGKSFIRTFSVLFFLNLIIFNSVENSNAEVKYVSDFLIVNIRNAIEKPYYVITTIKSDDKVEVLEENGRYVKVLTADGKEGWVSQQYLKSSLPKKVIISNLKQKVVELETQLQTFNNNPDISGANQTIHRLQQELSSMKEKLTLLDKENTSLKSIAQKSTTKISDSAIGLSEKLEFLQEENSKLLETIDKLKSSEQFSSLQEELTKLQTKYDTLLNASENVLQISNKNKKLLTSVASLEIEIMELTSVNKTLQNKKMIYIFVAGAVVFLFGIFFGKLGSKKRNRFSY